ncbi:alpha/beta fold hydrolase [Nonomuraea typhae]|uniref:alpha/beta fold hydrolase n=1 Tax=Nonomuraea typhae TaxID=2603600 RepID=UPI0012F8F046|nr:alpha/beta fold hydrolase [Nonomuraea typhae]
MLTLAGAVAGPPAAGAAFLGAAAVVPSLAVMVVAGLAALGAGCLLPAWGAARLVRRRLPLVVAGGVVVVCVAASAVVFVPGQASVPRAERAYWDLGTGSRVAYRVTRAEGAARPVPVIRLHGGPGTPGEGEDALDRALSGAGFDVYAYDQLGSGDSPRPDDVSGYTVERQVADLEAVRRRLGAERVILVGASWGATLAAEYLARHPGHVAKVVFVSPGALWTPEWSDEEAGQLWDRLTPGQAARVGALGENARFAVWETLMAIDPRAAHALVPDAEVDHLFGELLRIAGGAASCRPGGAELPAKVPGFYANQLITADQQSRPDPRPALRRAGVPALVLRAECDYKRWPVTREYRDTIPGARLVYVKGAGHAIGLDRPAEFAATVTAFLTGAPLPLPPYTGVEDPAAR